MQIFWVQLGSETELEARVRKRKNGRATIKGDITGENIRVGDI